MSSLYECVWKRSVRSAVLAGAMVMMLACSPVHATTTIGNNFDGIMSVIYDDSSGNVFLENSGLSSPSVDHMSIASAGGWLLPGNLNLPVLAPNVTVTSATPSLIDFQWSSGDFLGTGSYLGMILGTGLSQGALLSDLTILWGGLNSPWGAGDLLHGTYGTTPGNPVLPGAGADGFWKFFDVDSGQFFDPPLATGFQYTMVDGSKFTKLGLPIGYGNSFDVVVGGTTVASGLTANSSYTFAGGGVASFSLVGIDPAVDPANGDAFPLYLEFNTSLASFNMEAIPEPATLSLLALGGMTLTRRRRR